jgi:formylglycine-generating enzyme
MRASSASLIRTIVALACLGGWACSLTTSLDGLDDGASDGGASDGGLDAAKEGSTDAGTNDDGGEESSTDAAASDGACPGTGGPVAVHAGSFCIDSTEVTNAEYASFLAVNYGGSVPPVCAFKSTYVPIEWPAASADTPVVWVDWCDAYVFCAWAGKRLCGKVGGGPSTSLADTTDQWFSACSHDDDGAHDYAYGDTFVPRTCNTPESDAGGVLPVGTLAGCTGGYPGAFDMIGNVYEWEDSCVGSAGATDSCALRSGSFVDPPGASDTCANSGAQARNFTQPDFGFRCCSP